EEDRQAESELHERTPVENGMRFLRLKRSQEKTLCWVARPESSKGVCGSEDTPFEDSGRATRDRPPRLNGSLVNAGHGGGDAAARGEGPHDLAAPRRARLDEVVEQPIDDRLVEAALGAVALQVELEGLQLDAQLIGDITEGDGAEVGLAGLGTQAG